MKTMLRLISSVVVVLAALAITAGAVGATPTLGGRISPANLVWEETQSIEVTSLCKETDCTAVIGTDGPGWAFDATTFVLKPGETKVVVVTSAGKDDSTYTVTLSPAKSSVAQSGDSNGLALTGKLRHRGAYVDLAGPLAVSGAGLALTLLLGLALLGLRWGRRHLRVV